MKYEVQFDDGEYQHTMFIDTPHTVQQRGVDLVQIGPDVLLKLRCMKIDHVKSLTTEPQPAVALGQGGGTTS